MFCVVSVDSTKKFFGTIDGLFAYINTHADVVEDFAGY
jgi:hypothetical protein